MTASHRSYFLTELSWPEVASHLKQESRLIVPVGACDQYGLHLPLGASTRVAEAIAADLSREFGVLCAPAFPYGVNVTTKRPFAGAASLREKTLHRALNDLLAAWESQGFTEFIMITVQGYDPHVEAIAAVIVGTARVRVVEALCMDFSPFLDGAGGPQHAGEIETSLLLHLFPEIVRMEAAEDFIPDPSRFPLFGRGIPPLPGDSPGSVGRPTLASAEKGERIYAHILQKIREKIFLAPPEAEE